MSDRSHPALIRAEDVVLEYPVGPVARGSIKAILFGNKKSNTTVAPPTFVRALAGVSFDIAEGERVGVIGSNGSGKSTLLRVLAGIYPPTSGRVVTRGVIQSMFDLTTGFETEATGRENIRYRGLVMGFSPAEISTRMQDIIAFADIGTFIDLPVRTYSAGMTVRLAFAISTYLSGDILLIDEVFGAGDAAFQSKAVARMRNVIGSARIVVMVAHDLSLMRDLMTRVLWLHKGNLILDGDPQTVTSAYLELAKSQAA